MTSQCASEDTGREQSNPLKNLKIKEEHNPKEYSASKKNNAVSMNDVITFDHRRWE